ncbi:MAG: choice-of-anchor tandem repeat GloVer-containing protein, partial [Terriglobales bacterium]
MTAIRLAMLAAVVMFAGAAVPAQAQTPTVLYRFAGFNGDACATRGNIVQGRDGNMYGGGAAACGTGSGTIYKISPAGVESAFFIFPSQWLNCGGAGLTLGSDGNFYGTCISGNPATGMGSIFRLTPAGVFTDLHDFDGTNGDSLPVYPPIQASDGNFYGVSGNEVQVCGNIYKMTPAGVYTNLHTFVFNNSECHSSNLVQASDGNLYGTLANCTLPGSVGCVYKISTAGVFKEIHGFTFTTGQVPCTGLIQGKDGKLYGATNQGATNNNGNIYKMTTAGVATDLHDFTNATDASCVNNVGPPVNLLQVADGAFYGVNPAYGPNGTGSIYKLTSA